MSKIMEVLKEMPIYPDGIKLGKNQNLNFAPETPICEENGFFSWISQKAKDEYLKDYKWRDSHTRRAR